ncbi:MAG: hypothetical protein R3223_13390, partial [Longimicrobiales bacterium]|nr:hypothetical protein [Longimicrobiales bacterium]
MGGRDLKSGPKKAASPEAPGNEAGERSGWGSIARGVAGILVFLAGIRLLGEASGAVSDEL